ncbi:MAG: hypothetical protein V7K57_18365 [Nostoc sp.]
MSIQTISLIISDKLNYWPTMPLYRLTMLLYRLTMLLSRPALALQEYKI